MQSLVELIFLVRIIDKMYKVSYQINMKQRIGFFYI